MVVVIRKTDFGYSWQPNNGRAYTIQLEQIMPQRFKQILIDTFRDDAKAKITVPYYIYDRTNKILFLSNTRII